MGEEAVFISGRDLGWSVAKPGFQLEFRFDSGEISHDVIILGIRQTVNSPFPLEYGTSDTSYLKGKHFFVTYW